MGISHVERRTPFAWQQDLAALRAAGAKLAQTADCRCRHRWLEHDLDALIARFGAAYSPWDKRPACVACGKPGHYMATPGEGTPYRPMRSGVVHDEEHRAFLKGFGFSKRDVARIQALAGRVTARSGGRELADLDVPYRVAACWPGDEARSTGEILGDWEGRTLLFWRMTPAETQAWRRKRRGPKPL